ncbi:hypothetical protein E2C01_085270 [Portunus trituberculatus]|uniref:Uncharacterized protein n=1 Tax=Portunus trituberculatus TaxID=210409 RepID=A0A5B7J755_PORTR|nr:hypothetical protein [Portunus trituberculatus]
MKAHLMAITCLRSELGIDRYNEPAHILSLPARITLIKSQKTHIMGLAAWTTSNGELAPPKKFSINNLRKSASDMSESYGRFTPEDEAHDESRADFGLLWVHTGCDARRDLPCGGGWLTEQFLLQSYEEII